MTNGDVIETFREQLSLKTRRRAIGREDVGHAGTSQRPRRNGAWQVSTGMEMRDVERATMSCEKGAQPPRGEQLMAIRQPVRDIGKDTQGIVGIGADFLPKPGRRIADIGGTQGDGMSAFGKTVHECAGKSGNTSIRPGIRRVRRNMKDPHSRFFSDS